MENLFKDPGCDQQSFNPIVNALSGFMMSDPSQHLHESQFPGFEGLQDAWEEGEAMQSHPYESHPYESHWNAGETPEEIWTRLAGANNLDQAWGESEQLRAELDEEDSDEVNEFLQDWNKQNPNTYTFQTENKYSACSNCYDLAIEKERIGETDEAILLLEMEVQRTPEHSEAWGLLGRLHAKNDEDSRAIAAMLRGLEIDPYNLDLLMSLGISCTNEFDEAQALNYLKTWIQHHPLYAEIPVHENKDLKEDILEAFHVAASINMQDPDVFQALGVLHYLTGEFEQAEENFRAALMLKQDDAALWNRLGAALAKQKKTEEAFECYHKALEMKPDFVRTWGNLGLAYAGIKDYHMCARFYLCALSLNPNATHLYNYLSTAFLMMDRYDLLEKLALRNPMIFANEFQIITRDQLPKGSAWAEEFNNL